MIPSNRDELKLVACPPVGDNCIGKSSLLAWHRKLMTPPSDVRSPMTWERERESPMAKRRPPGAGAAEQTVPPFRSDSRAVAAPQMNGHVDRNSAGACPLKGGRECGMNLPQCPVEPRRCPRETSPPAPNVNILLVNDTPGNLMVLDAILSELGQNPRASPAPATKQYGGYSRRTSPSSFWTSRCPTWRVSRPPRLVRGRDRSRLTPIIFLTAYEHKDSQILRSYDIGAVDFLFKPIVPEVLRSKVRVFVEPLPEDRADRPASRQTPRERRTQ